MEFLVAALGLIILVFAGDALVRGAVNIALRLGIPALVVSLTVVAFGTSAPEMLVSIRATLDGAPGLALGNVVGSNIANILLVLGVPALISGLDMSGSDTRRSYAVMLGVTAIFIAVSAFGPIGLPHALLLLAVLALVLGDQFRDALAHRRAGEAAPEEVEEADPEMPWWKIGAFTLGGLIGLPLGANLLVTSATEIASRYGVSDSVIGLTLVAVGTSLPELATTVMAAIRRQADVALGNVIGSNVFNLLAILGVTGLIAPIPVDPQFLRFDLWVMAAASLLIFPFVIWQWSMTKRWGILFTALFASYIYATIM
ncbi:calcium/sodium antiporter [Profundibacterium mesophilum]|uniref:Sodiumcalcium exchanger n=1 Tax=Profundibacterium mesophilum KAUST100406-0324 TaxID=1037889 RepID=A0A921TBP4_9RHOB|nr:calcium/sodium antiporter [Profundibacterium mesophilum]KAF0675990.1 Sodiumcalcium exchanger [Profundibacterium mesophilum KAUST100406-0324]